MKIAPFTAQIEDIVRHDECFETAYFKGKTYLKRWFLTAPSDGKVHSDSLFIHHIVSADTLNPHSHSWDFLTYLMKGSQIDHVYDQQGQHLASLILQAPLLIYRPHHLIHKVNPLDGGTISIVQTGSRKATSSIYTSSGRIIPILDVLKVSDNGAIHA